MRWQSGWVFSQTTITLPDRIPFVRNSESLVAPHGLRSGVGTLLTLTSLIHPSLYITALPIKSFSFAYRELASLNHNYYYYYDVCKINFARRRDVVSQQRIVRPFLVSCYSPGTFVVRPHQGNTGKMSSSGTVEQGTIIIIIIRVMSNASQKMVSLIGHITFGASTTKEPRSADMCSTLSTQWMAGGADKIKFNKECFCILNMVRNTLKNPHQTTSTTKLFRGYVLSTTL